MSTVKDGLLYTKDDEWIAVNGETGTVGITDYAQDSLSDIVYLELPNVGDSFESGENFGVVESVKAAADLFMPVSGQVTAVNDALIDAPEEINQSPTTPGWSKSIRQPRGTRRINGRRRLPQIPDRT